MASRRDLLKLGLATAALSLPGCKGRSLAAEPSRRARPAPRYFVILFLRGGIDAIYTTNPRSRAEVSSRVEVPYGANAILDAGGIRLGPHLAPLAPWAPRLSIVNGVRVHTANHMTGALQMLRLRTAVTPEMPSFLDVIGAHRDTQPLASVTLGTVSGLEHAPGWFGGPSTASNTIFDRIDAARPDELAALARTYRRHAGRARAWGAQGRGRASRDSLAQAAAFFERLGRVPRFAVPPGQDDATRIARDLERTLWLLEHDLTRGVFVKVLLEWDSHYRNATRQAESSATFFPALARFFQGLHQRRNAHGTLAEQTVVVVGSELGRFPALNGNLGKDHFPEAPYLVMGPGLARGKVFGATGRDLEGLPTDLKTGQAQKGGHLLTLDDLGTTLLHHAGLDPAVYGYGGRRLRFLEAA